MVIATHSPTCLGATHHELDFFVVSKVLAPLLSVEAIQGSSLAPHKPVRLFLAAFEKDQMVERLCQPRRSSASPVFGPVQQPSPSLWEQCGQSLFAQAGDPALTVQASASQLGLLEDALADWNSRALQEAGPLFGMEQDAGKKFVIGKVALSSMFVARTSSTKLPSLAMITVGRRLLEIAVTCQKPGTGILGTGCRWWKVVP